MNQVRYTRFLAVAVVALLVGACNSSTSSTAPTSASAAPASAAPASAAAASAAPASAAAASAAAKPITVAYITPSLSVPFWKWMSGGVHEAAAKVGATVIDYDSNNDGTKQLANAQDAITKHVDAIVMSPTDSSAAPAVLQAAATANIPVVIADIGTTSGTYLAFLTSTNEQGSNQAGAYLAQKLTAKGWASGPVGEVTIPLARNNGKLRTKGFADAMAAANIPIAGQLSWTTDTTAENEGLVQNIVTAHPGIHGFYCQSDDCTLAAVSVLKQAGKLNTSTLVMGFDGSPATVDCIKQGLVLGAAVQLPVEIGATSFQIAYDFVVNQKSPTQKDQLIPTVLVTQDNIATASQQLIDTAYPADAATGAGSTCPVQ